jgi:hypothetical protein
MLPSVWHGFGWPRLWLEFGGDGEIETGRLELIGALEHGAVHLDVLED